MNQEEVAMRAVLKELGADLTLEKHPARLNELEWVIVCEGVERRIAYKSLHELRGDPEAIVERLSDAVKACKREALMREQARLP